MQNTPNFLSEWIKQVQACQTVLTPQYQYQQRDLIHTCDMVKLFHYHAQAKVVQRTPTLIVFSTFYRPEILDINANKSFIANLLKKGVDTYLLDWGNPKELNCEMTLNDYLLYLQKFICFIKEKYRLEKINIIGICQGGVLSLCYAALKNDIKNLILLSTPIDFHTNDHLIANLISRFDTSYLHSMLHIPGSFLAGFFNSIHPTNLFGIKYLKLLDHAEDKEWIENFFRVEKWINDVPDSSSGALAEFIKTFYQHNKLIKDDCTLLNKKICLTNLILPILNIMAKFDDLVPNSTSRVLKKYVSSKDVSERYFASGHIGIYINPLITKRIACSIASWLKKRDQ